MPPLVLFVGARGAAFKAARRLGLDWAVLAPPGKLKARLRAGERAAEIALGSAPDRIEARARELLEGRPPDEVVALTERAVLPAARLREAFGVPGLGVSAARALSHKSRMKERLLAAGLPCVPTQAIGSLEEAGRVAAEIDFPLVVKALSSSGGRGMSLVTAERELAPALAGILEQPELGGAGMEPFIHGTELSVEALHCRGELRFLNVTEYLEPGWANLLPAELTPARAAEVQDLVLRALAAFGFDHGPSHSELYLTRGGAVLGEVNARPPGGGLMHLISLAYGADAWEAFLAPASAAEGRSLPADAQRVAGNLFVHPGPGKVVSVNGWEDVCRLPGVQEGKLRLQPGDEVGAREGTGQSRGEIVVVGATAAEVRETLLAAQRCLRIEVEPLPGPATRQG